MLRETSRALAKGSRDTLTIPWWSCRETLLHFVSKRLLFLSAPPKHPSLTQLSKSLPPWQTRRTQLPMRRQRLRRLLLRRLELTQGRQAGNTRRSRLALSAFRYVIQPRQASSRGRTLRLRFLIDADAMCIVVVRESTMADLYGCFGLFHVPW